MIDGILKSQFATVFWYHRPIVFLAQQEISCGSKPLARRRLLNRLAASSETTQCDALGAAAR